MININYVYEYAPLRHVDAASASSSSRVASVLGLLAAVAGAVVPRDASGAPSLSHLLSRTLLSCASPPERPREPRLIRRNAARETGCGGAVRPLV
eukprot:scaffold2908_cov257-Pinguiococcus_pyrenoidosus.AAC.10